MSFLLRIYLYVQYKKISVIRLYYSLPCINSEWIKHAQNSHSMHANSLTKSTSVFNYWFFIFEQTLPCTITTPYCDKYMRVLNIKMNNNGGSSFLRIFIFRSGPMVDMFEASIHFYFSFLLLLLPNNRKTRK